MENRYPTTIFNDADIAAKIDTPVFQEVISKRTGRGNTALSYLRGDIIADQLNSIFGPLGWDLRAGVPSIDHWEGEKETGGYNNQPKKMVNMHTVQVMTQMTLRIKARSVEDTDTIFTQTGIGYGEIEATKNRKEVVGMALKGAETDGLKRCASLLGRAMGMFLTGTGVQDEIDYAHNGKAADITKGKRMRDERLRNERQNNGADTPRLEDRSQQRQLEDRSNDRDNNQGDRGNARTDSRSNNQDRQEDHREERRPAQTQERRVDKAPAKPAAEKPAAQKAAAPETKGGKADASSGAEKGKAPGFDLEQIPVTGDDQIAFSVEILARLDEFNQSSDKEKFIKGHYNTIKNLDSKYRRRLIERLTEQQIDFEALGAK